MSKIVEWGDSVVEPSPKAVEASKTATTISSEERDSLYEVPLVGTSGFENEEVWSPVDTEDLLACSYSDSSPFPQEVSFSEVEKAPNLSGTLELRCRPCKDMARISDNLYSERVVEESYEAKIIQALKKLRFAWIKEMHGDRYYDISRAELDGIKTLVNQAAKVKDLDYFQISLALLEVSERSFRNHDDEHPNTKRGFAPHLQKLVTFIDEKSQGLV